MKKENEFDFDQGRLVSQAAITINLELDALSSLGLVDGTKILDVGCGTGTFAGYLKTRFKNIIVDGIDINESYRNIGLGSKSINNFYVLDALTGEWPQNLYDFVYTRLVLQHVADPCKLIHRMSNQTVKGGHVILIESDPTSFITIPYLGAIHEAYDKCRQRRREVTQGSDPLVGQHMVELARKANLVNLSTRIVTVSNRQFVSEMDPTGIRFLRDNLLGFLWSPLATGESSEWCERVRKRFEDWGKTNQAYFTWSLLFVSGEKQ